MLQSQSDTFGNDYTCNRLCVACYSVIITASGAESTFRVSDSRRTIDSIRASRTLKALYLYICSGVWVIVLVDCRGRVFGMVHVAQDCGGGVCSLAEPATGLRFSEPCSGRAASRVASLAKLKYPRCHGFHHSHTTSKYHVARVHLLEVNQTT